MYVKARKKKNSYDVETYVVCCDRLKVAWYANAYDYLSIQLDDINGKISLVLNRVGYYNETYQDMEPITYCPFCGDKHVVEVV